VEARQLLDTSIHFESQAPAQSSRRPIEVSAMQAIRFISPSTAHTAQSWIVCDDASEQLRGSPQAACIRNREEFDSRSIGHQRPNGLNPRTLQKTLNYIREHLSDSISLEDLARVACISQFHFARQFRLSTGLSPIAFILKARVEAARELLCRGEQKISTLAVALGFFDQSHFSRAFRRVTGLAPRQYAREVHGDRCAASRITPVSHQRSMPTRSSESHLSKSVNSR
jgi:AraC family transcriptional regulator